MWHLADPNPFLEAINSQQEAANRVLRHRRRSDAIAVNFTGQLISVRQPCRSGET